MQEKNRNTELKPFKESFKNDFAIINSMTVYRSGRQRCAPGFCRHNRIYNFYILHYVTKGKGSIKHLTFYKDGDTLEMHREPGGLPDGEKGDLCRAYLSSSTVPVRLCVSVGCSSVR